MSDNLFSQTPHLLTELLRHRWFQQVKRRSHLLFLHTRTRQDGHGVAGCVVRVVVVYVVMCIVGGVSGVVMDILGRFLSLNNLLEVLLLSVNVARLRHHHRGGKSSFVTTFDSNFYLVVFYGLFTHLCRLKVHHYFIAVDLGSTFPFL